MNCEAGLGFAVQEDNEAVLVARLTNNELWGLVRGEKF